MCVLVSLPSSEDRCSRSSRIPCFSHVSMLAVCADTGKILKPRRILSAFGKNTASNDGADAPRHAAKLPECFPCRSCRSCRFQDGACLRFFPRPRRRLSQDGLKTAPFKTAPVPKTTPDACLRFKGLRPNAPTIRKTGNFNQKARATVEAGLGPTSDEETADRPW